jgi:aspartate/methionine/tyrosine aminotransferase
MTDPRELRRTLHERHRQAFASVPIRLISKIDQEARTLLAAEDDRPYDGFSGAIGDVAAHALPEDLRAALYFGREEELRAEGERRLRAETPRYTSYDFAGTGYTCLKEAWLDTYRPFTPETDAFRPYPFYGGTHAFAMTLQAIARMLGTRIKALVPVPSFPPFFFQLAQHFEVVCRATRPDQGFRLQAEDVATIPRDELALVYLCVIGNPTGLAYAPDELAALTAAIVARHPEAIILLDAVYLRTLPTADAAALWRTMTAPSTRANVVIFDSLSKTFGRTGLRSGVVFLDHPRLEQALVDFAQNELAGISYAMQIEAVGLLRLVGEDAVQGLAQVVAARRARFLAERLPQYADYFVPRAKQPLLPAEDRWQGGMYAFLRLRNNVEALEFFIETGVACVPGIAFFGPGRQHAREPFIRLSFGMEG